MSRRGRARSYLLELQLAGSAREDVAPVAAWITSALPPASSASFDSTRTVHVTHPATPEGVTSSVRPVDARRPPRPARVARWAALRGRGYSPTAARSAAKSTAGGWSTPPSDFGDGQTGVRGPIVAAYEPSGALAWRRVIGGASGRVTGGRTSGANRVAFSAELGQEFLFGGARFFIGDVPDDPRSFLGVLGNGGGEDGWLRQLEASAGGLAADDSGIIVSDTGFRTGGRISSTCSSRLEAGCSRRFPEEPS